MSLALEKESVCGRRNEQSMVAKPVSDCWQGGQSFNKVTVKTGLQRQQISVHCVEDRYANPPVIQAWPLVAAAASGARRSHHREDCLG